MNYKVSFVIVAALLGLASSRNYEGHKVYSITPQTESVLRFLHGLQDIDGDNYNLWSRTTVVGRTVRMMVGPEVQEDFEEYLDLNESPYEILIDDVQSTIRSEKEYHLNLAEPTGRITFDRYYTHAQINQYLDALTGNFSSLVNVSSIGLSYEKRDIRVIRISSGASATPKPVILIDAGIHAREWIAPAVALYMINQLVENKTNAHFLEKIDWVIIPNLNPDGYDYTWTKDRYWRKTRSPAPTGTCFGVDPNRNFGFHWGESGASTRSCDETYAGPRAFSEVEMQHFRDYVLKLTNVKAYITLHSAGSYFLYPYGYSTRNLAPNWKELDTLGHNMANAITAVHGSKYVVGNSGVALYPASGASDDWTMGVANVSIVYTIELPEGGRTGFDMPPEGINRVVTETFEAFRVLHDYIVSQN